MAAELWLPALGLSLASMGFGPLWGSVVFWVHGPWGPGSQAQQQARLQSPSREGPKKTKANKRYLKNGHIKKIKFKIASFTFKIPTPFGPFSEPR